MDTHVCSATCNDKEHVRAENVNDDAIILLDASGAGYPDVAVQTTHREIMNMVNATLDECKQVLPQVTQALRNKNIDKMFAEKGEEWKDFCDDVAIYYACRFKVHGTLIPICKQPAHDLD